MVHVRRNISVLMEAGMSEQEAIYSLRTLRRFAVGSAIEEQANREMPVRHASDEGNEVFEFGLTAIIESLRRIVARTA